MRVMSASCRRVKVAKSARRALPFDGLPIIVATLLLALLQGTAFCARLFIVLINDSVTSSTVRHLDLPLIGPRIGEARFFLPATIGG